MMQPTDNFPSNESSTAHCLLQISKAKLAYQHTH
jgi:hypothetical protein